MISYTVTAEPRTPDMSTLVFEDVYDIGHYYARGTSMDNEYIRLLCNYSHPDRKHIDLTKYDVHIHLNDSTPEKLKCPERKKEEG